MLQLKVGVSLLILQLLFGNVRRAAVNKAIEAEQQQLAYEVPSVFYSFHH